MFLFKGETALMAAARGGNLDNKIQLAISINHVLYYHVSV